MKHTANSTTLHRPVALLLAAAALWLALPAQSRAGDVSFVVLTKGQSYRQTNATTTLAPTTVDGTNVKTAFNIFAFVQGTGVVSATAFNVAEPGFPVTFMAESNQFEFVYQEYAASNAELEGELLPPGRYTINIATSNDGPRTATVTLPATAYPNIPKILNWADAQHADPFSDFRLSWTPMTGGTAQDFIFVNIQADGGGDSAFETPFIHEPGQLNGLSNSVVIPGGTLEPGKTYYANITFVNVASMNTTVIPGAFVAVAFVRETEFTLLTETNPPGGNIRFASTNLSVNETDGHLTVSLNRVGGSDGEVTVLVSSLGGTAIAGVDFTSVSETVTFNDGETSKTVDITILDDFLLEGSERFRLGLSGVTGGATLTRDTNAIVTIIDNESAAAGKLNFSAAAYQVLEADTTVNVIVRREGGTTGTVGGTIEIFDGSADDGDDYETTNSLPTMTFTIPDGKNASTNLITILNDDLPEGNETILMRLKDPTGGAIIGKIGTNTTTILDDEITIQFAVARSTNIENKVEAKIEVVRTGPSTEAASVDYAAFVPEDTFAEAFSLFTIEYLIEHQTPQSFTTAIDVAYATSGVDFLGTTGTLVFPKGVTKKSFTVRLIDDLTVEGTEDIRLLLRNPSTNAQLGELDSALLYIKDNDLGGTINFVMTNQNVKESVGDAKIMVTRTGGLASNVTVRLSTVAGTATDGLDYIGFTTNLTFGAKEGKKTIPLSVIQDFLVEDTERLTLILTDVSNNASNGPRTNLTVNIADDDKGGTISFDKILHSVNESVTNLALIIKRTGGGAGNVTVRLQSANGPTNSATAGSDYLALDTVITFGPGETRKTNTLHIINDSIADAALSETIALSLREYTGGAKPGASNAVVAIIDDESSVSFASATTTGVENQTVTITVVRGGFLGSTSTVEYMFMDGTATNGSDYKGTNGTLTFLPKQFSKTITVPIISDLNTETNLETFTVILKNATNALLGTITTNTVSITDAPAVGAIPLDRPEFLKAVTRGVTNSSFNRSITINDGGVDFIQLSAIGNNYGIQARDNIFSPSGSEAFLISINNVTGPGVFNVTPNGL